jgi:hypothetical protein
MERLMAPLALLLSSACGAPGAQEFTSDDNESEPQDTPAQVSPPEQATAAKGETTVSTAPLAVDRLEMDAERIRAIAERTDDGRALLGDMLFDSEEELEETLLAHGGEHDKAFYWSTKLWSKHRFTVCFTTDSDSTTAQRKRVADLIHGTWEAVADVDFVENGGASGFPTCTATGADITIRHSSTVTRGLSAIGTGSSSGSNSSPSMLLPSTGTVAWQESTAIHEFGHAIGFIHEFLRSEYLNQAYNNPANAWNCAGADDNITKGEKAPASGGVTVGAYDPLSIMNYCTANTLLLTATDTQAVQQMYGSSTWRFVVNLKGWGEHPAVTVVTQNTTRGTSSSGTWDLQSSDTILASVNEDYTLGDSWAASGSVADASWRCKGSSGVTPPGGFETTPMMVQCYRPAEIVTIL